MEHRVVIQAGRAGQQYWNDLLRFRELFWFLAWRDVLVRYKQTVVGVAWAVIRPLLMMIVFSIVFGRLAKLPADGIPYPILVFAAMLPWQFFASSLSESSNSLVSNANLVSKIYFPRLILPTSSVIVAFVDFAISFMILVGLMIWYGFVPSARVLTLPLLVVLAFLAALGPGLLVAALNVRYRDFRYVIPFVVQMGLYISPVGFQSSVIPEKWRLLYSMNPMVGVIDGFRWAICGNASLYLPGFALSLVLVILMLALGVTFFRKTERTFADVI